MYVAACPSFVCFPTMSDWSSPPWLCSPVAYDLVCLSSVSPFVPCLLVLCFHRASAFIVTSCSIHRWHFLLLVFCLLLLKANKGRGCLLSGRMTWSGCFRDYLLKLKSRGTTSRRLKTLPQSIIIIIFFHNTQHGNKAPRVRGCKTYPQHDALNPTCNCEDWVVGVEGLSLSSPYISNIHVPKHQTKAPSSRTHLYLSNVHGQTSVWLWCTALWPWSPPWWRVLTTVFPAHQLQKRPGQ